MSFTFRLSVLRWLMILHAQHHNHSNSDFLNRKMFNTIAVVARVAVLNIRFEPITAFLLIVLTKYLMIFNDKDF